MNQSAAYVHHEESEHPQDQEYYRDGPKHYGILAKVSCTGKTWTPIERARPDSADGAIIRLRLSLGNHRTVASGVLSEEVELRPGIVPRLAANYAREGGERMRLESVVENVQHLYPARGQSI